VSIYPFLLLINNQIYMEELKKIEDMAGHIKEYARVRIAEARMEVVEKAAGVLAQLVARMFVVLIYAAGVGFVAVAGAFVLGRWMGSMAGGFLVAAGFFLLAGVIAGIAKRRLICEPVMDEIIFQLYENNEDDEED
jgi:hypothetical protein